MHGILRQRSAGLGRLPRLQCQTKKAGARWWRDDEWTACILDGDPWAGDVARSLQVPSANVPTQDDLIVGMLDVDSRREDALAERFHHRTAFLKRRIKCCQSNARHPSARIPHYASSITHPASRIAHHVSLITHHVSRITPSLDLGSWFLDLVRFALADSFNAFNNLTYLTSTRPASLISPSSDLGSFLDLGPWILDLPTALAQLAPPDPAHFTNWLLSATAALSIAALGKQFIRKTPLESQFLTRKEFAEFTEKLDADLVAISAKIDRSHDLLSHRLDTLSVRLDEVRSLVDRVDERTKNLTDY